MKNITIEKFRKYEISSVEELEKTYLLKADFRHLVTYYTIEKKLIDFVDLEYIIRFADGTHRLFIVVDSENNYIQLETSKRIVRKGVAIEKFELEELVPIEYINYYQYDIFTQLDGITTIVGMSGAGKTYSALSMMDIYEKGFTKIAYLNYELTTRDIYKRMKSMYSDEAVERIIDKLYMKKGIMSSLDLEEILMAMDVMPDDKVVFVVDNVGSVKGQEEGNVFLQQNIFLKQLDVICKERGYHALALTQTIKDHNLDIFDDNDEIKGSITMAIMSGSIELGNLSRSVLFTGRNGKTNEFKVKVLKKGTGLFYDVEGVDEEDDYIRL